MGKINLFYGLMDIFQGLAINRYYGCPENLHSVVLRVYNRPISRATEKDRRKVSVSEERTPGK